MSLKVTLFNLFGVGEPIHRRTLSHYSDYDSLTRALGQLVREGKLVRTGPGQFMRPGSVYVPKSAEPLSDLVEKHIGKSRRNVFLRKDFQDFGNADAVGGALRKLVANGKLVRIGKGLYARSSGGTEDDCPMPQVALEELAVEALLRLGKTVVGPDPVPSNPDALSISSVGDTPILITNVVSRRIGYKGKFVHIERLSKALSKDEPT